MVGIPWVFLLTGFFGMDITTLRGGAHAVRTRRARGGDVDTGVTAIIQAMSVGDVFHGCVRILYLGACVLNADAVHR